MDINYLFERYHINNEVVAQDVNVYCDLDDLERREALESITAMKGEIGPLNDFYVTAHKHGDYYAHENYIEAKSMYEDYSDPEDPRDELLVAASFSYDVVYQLNNQFFVIKKDNNSIRIETISL